MKFTLEIDCDNSAFGDTYGETVEEIARILRETAERIEAHEAASNAQFRLSDYNGNRVGAYKFDGEFGASH